MEGNHQREAKWYNGHYYAVIIILQALRLWYVAVSNILHRRFGFTRSAGEPLAQRQLTSQEITFPPLDQEEKISVHIIVLFMKHLLSLTLSLRFSNN